MYRCHLGVIKLAACEHKQGQRRQRHQVSWEATKASRAMNSASFLHMRSQPLFPVRYLVARSSDRCEVDSWVVAHSPQHVRIHRVLVTSEAYEQQTELGEECLRANR